MKHSSSITKQFFDPPASRRRRSIPKGVISPGELEDRYCLTDKQLGKGSFSSIVLALHIGTSTRVAVKRIKKINRVPSEKAKSQVEAVLRNEVNALVRLDHDNILRLLDLFQSPGQDSIDMVLELAEGGNLESFRRKGEFTLHEKEIALIAADLTSALIHMHQNGVIHRDLKPENILVSQARSVSPRKMGENHPVVKVCDFGLAYVSEKITDVRFTRSSSDLRMSTWCGSKLYCAPEVIAKLPYTSAVDLWGLGLILFYLFSGELPYPASLRYVSSCTSLLGSIEPTGSAPASPIKMRHSQSTSAVTIPTPGTSWSSFRKRSKDVATVNQSRSESASNDHISDAFSEPVWNNISTDAQDTIRTLLAYDQSKRYTLSELKKLPWICSCPATTKIPWDQYRGPRRLSAPSSLETHNSLHGFPAPCPSNTVGIKHRHGLPTHAANVLLSKILHKNSSSELPSNTITTEAGSFSTPRKDTTKQLAAEVIQDGACVRVSNLDKPNISVADDGLMKEVAESQGEVFSNSHQVGALEISEKGVHRSLSRDPTSSERCLACGAGVKTDELEQHLLECTQTTSSAGVQPSSMPPIGVQNDTSLAGKKSK